MVIIASNRFEKGFETDIELHSIDEPVKRCDLVDEDRTRCKPLGVNRTLGWDLTMRVEDAFEVVVEILDSQGPEFVKDPFYLHTISRMGVGTVLGCDKDDALRAFGDWGIVVQISQDESGLEGELWDEEFCCFIVWYISRSKLCSKRDPHRGYGGDKMKLPTIGPAMPAGFGPMGFGIDGGMRDFPFFSIPLVPHSSLSSKRVAPTCGVSR